MTRIPFLDADLARIAGFTEDKWFKATPEARLDAIRERGVVPDACGPEIPVAPARGSFRTFEPVALYPKGRDQWEAKPSGYQGRKGVRVADAFDVMAGAAARKRRAAPFSPTQVAMGRFYRALFERHDAAGPRSVSLETGGGGSGGGQGSFIDAVLRDRERLDVLRRRIGPGSAMVVRRIRPSERGSRTTIFDRRAVDMICLEDATCADVLRAHGWSVKGDTVRCLAQAVADALDRMCGPTYERRIFAAHFVGGGAG